MKSSRKKSEILSNSVFGWAPSVLDGTEHIAQYENQELPDSFSYEGVIPGVLNQGQTSTCVPHSVSSIMDWYMSLKMGRPTSFNMSIYNIYNRKDNYGDGMTFKCALSILKNIGAVTAKEYNTNNYNNAVKIREYALIRNLYSLKYSIIMNGPCLIATMVKSMNDDYWNGTENYGGHAVSCVGWDTTGIIIRNSWGSSWGNNGYTHMPYKDFSKILEAWTAIF